MSVDVQQAISIDRPRPQVAAYAMDPPHDTEWIGGITQVELLGDPPVRVGTRVRRVARFLGRRIDYVLEVTEHEPAGHLRMRTVRGPFPMLVSYSFADDGAGTRASIRVQGDAGGFYRMAAPLLAGRVRRDLHADLERLKRILESGRPAPAGR